MHKDDNKKESPEEMLGRAVRECRKLRGWSQDELGHQTGLHRTYIGVVERGEKSISLRSLLIVAHSFGMKASELLSQAGL
jgi:transcriptional regulator with XRE-family HTH domain